MRVACDYKLHFVDNFTHFTVALGQTIFKGKIITREETKAYSLFECVYLCFLWIGVIFYA